ncbi:ATP-dependent DNA helicase [uncultured Williamsia sp.]|uniref:ATP-dependent helicase n=1 Tax=uncultured Williamsia sp. TaxID=259311 RepID=UPI002617744F|nr:ATP-dependent DNA helicase [uncultured Williamsia sp.]
MYDGSPQDTRSRRRVEVPATLVAAAHAEPTARTWDGAAARLVAAPLPGEGRGWQPIRITGGPGTGKTALVVDVAVSRLTAAGADPESVVLLASDRRAAVRLREEITRRVLARPDRDAARSSTREPLVRTVHSYAFAVLRLQASANGNPPPRLITGSEQDAVLRELLAGDIADGARDWPERLRPALHTDGFAQALRDLIMRAAERGVGPERLITLGRAHGRDEWVAAGIAYRQYEQTTLLRAAVGSASPQATSPAVDAAELIGSALTALSTDDALLAGERARIRHLLVDDAHHLDPQAADLVRLIGIGAAETVVAGDRDQTVFAFRGATPRFLDDLVDAGSSQDIVLSTDRRASPEITAVIDAIAARLPGAHRPARRPGDHPDDERPAMSVLGAGAPVRVESYASAAKEATAIADALRRAHVFEGVPWSQMAIVTRSVARSAAALRRALRATGVPVVTPASELPLHKQRSVAALLSVLRAVDGSIDGDEALALLSGPIGGADPTSVRRLRRGLRRSLDAEPAVSVTDSVDVIVAVLADDLDTPTGADAAARLDALTAPERAPLVRVRDVVRAARREHRRGGGVEDVLWAAWDATGLARRWSATALRGGPAADQADRDLDAVVALFDVAAGFTDNLPAAGVDAFVDHVCALRIAGDAPRRTGGADAVTIVSAHSAAGREWDVVAVAGVQDGLWPSLRSRGGILGTSALVDLLDGVAVDGLDTISRTAVAVADERRLFLVACSRARRRLLVTAVDDGSGDAAPSRFLVELAAVLAGDEPETDTPVVSADGLLEVAPAVRRTLSLPSIVAALRARVSADDPDPRVAEMLARLADAGVPGAHPDDWFGIAEPSTDAPLWDPSRGPITVSPSSVEAVHRCSLRWMFERAGGRDGDSAPAVAGTVVHTLVQALAGRIPPDEVTASLRRIWDQVDVGAQWYSTHELTRVESMLDHFGTWLERSRGDLEEIGVEVDVDVVLPPDPDDPSDAAVRIRGRIDRLERDAQGRPVIVDVKTGKTPISKDDAAEHPQLATYQLAVHLGGVEGVPRTEPGGGRLVYVSSSNRTTGAAERVQPPLTADHIAEWTRLVRDAARRSAGPTFLATVNPGCVRCPLTASCPASSAGKAVTDD